jgi:hypothetical protein
MTMTETRVIRWREAGEWNKKRDEALAFLVPFSGDAHRCCHMVLGLRNHM